MSNNWEIFVSIILGIGTIVRTGSALYAGKLG
jgi:hypothetical protein